MVSPSGTISATFSGTIAISASVDILVLLVERSSISGDGANLDILCCVGTKATGSSCGSSLSESPKKKVAGINDVRLRHCKRSKQDR